MMSDPSVSVVLPTYNRVKRLQRVLAALARQTYSMADLEVVVVSDGSTDGTDEYLTRAKFPFSLVAFTQDNAGPAAARNCGVELARAPLVVFIDDDVVPTSVLIEEHVRTHELSANDLVVVGPMITPTDFKLSAWVNWEQSMLYKQYDALLRGKYEATFRNFYTGNASLARAAVLGVNGFDVRLRRGEDVELGRRLAEAGYRFTFNAAAVGYHYAERTFESWLQNAWDYGVNAVILARERGWDELLQTTGDDFWSRNPLLRWMTRTCLRSPSFDSVIRQQLQAIAKASDFLHAEAVCRCALSGVYNLSYYQGLASELGDRRPLLEIMARAPS
jgi:glycosyltransferase involved in cell wall biosynthesis